MLKTARMTVVVLAVATLTGAALAADNIDNQRVDAEKRILLGGVGHIDRRRFPRNVWTM